MNLAQEPHQPEEQATKKARRARVRRIILLAIVLVLLMASGLAYRYWTETQILGEESINIVLIGVDTPLWEEVEAEDGLDAYPPAFGQFGYGADALAIGTINPLDKSIHIVSLPTSLLAILPGGDAGQLRDVFAAGGVPATQKVLEELLDIPVHHYVIVDYGGFTRLVDTVGGVELFVAEPIRYYDDGEVVFELEAGKHRLNGQEALKYVRYLPGADSERDRLERHKEFLSALGGQLFDTATLSQLPKLARLADELVETDLRWEKALKIAGILLRQKHHSLSVTLLPMDETGEQCVPDAEAIEALAEQLFHNPTWLQ